MASTREERRGDARRANVDDRAFDRPVIESEWFGCHPCRNTSSLRLKTRDVLDVFLKHTGHTATVVDL